MSEDTLQHIGPVWKWHGNGPAAWFFVTVDGAAGENLSALAVMRKLELGKQRGFGSLKVQVHIGSSTWKTSVFPDKTRGWLLPLKAAIRKAENIAEGDNVSLMLTVP